jgi:hypothetical protein
VPVTVAVRSEAWVLAGWLLGSWVRIPLKAWIFNSVRNFDFGWSELFGGQGVFCFFINLSKVNQW